jgi:hypothetical protein
MIRLVRRALTLIVGVLLLVLASPSAASACGEGVSYEAGGGGSPCPEVATVSAIAAFATAAGAATLALAVLSFLRGTMSQSDLNAVLDATLKPEAAARLRTEVELASMMAIYEGLGSIPPRFNIEANDVAHGSLGAHTMERHPPGLTRMRGAPGVRTLEGRIYGDPPWRNRENWSHRWVSSSVMNRTVNDYVASNWETIRSDLAEKGVFRAKFDAGHLTGDGFFNSGMYGTGPIAAEYMTTSYVQLTIRLVPGSNPPRPYIVRALPCGHLGE